MNIEELLTRGVQEVIIKSDLEKKLQSGKKLRIKFGVDPTRPDIHLGHAVVLWKLKQFQDDGHTIIFLIGDYTTKIGDPTGRNTTRPMLSDEDIKINAQTYIEQVGKILDMQKTEIRYNSEWYSKMDFSDIISLSSKFTVAQIIERDDFAKRLNSGVDIGLHEMLYPLMQAYDSVVLRADVAFGSDQKFNELAGRDLQKKMGQEPQDIVVTKLLVGTDGKEKMSKSLDNYIAITDLANEMYGKVMSIPDSAIMDYYELCTNVETKALKIIENELVNGKNPRDTKAELAKLIVEIYHNAEEAEEAEAEFSRVFSNREMPTEMREFSLNSKADWRLDDIVEASGTTERVRSKSDIRRLIQQGGVKLNDEKIVDPFKQIIFKADDILKVGNRDYIRIVK
jgi:tyrosyl-tRNA synthetase